MSKTYGIKIDSNKSGVSMDGSRAPPEVLPTCTHDQIWLDENHISWLWCIYCGQIGRILGYKEGVPDIHWTNQKMALNKGKGKRK